MRDLRGKYAHIRVDVPRTLINRAKRSHMIDGLIREEFGNEAVDAYNADVEEWNITEWGFLTS